MKPTKDQGHDDPIALSVDLHRDRKKVRYLSRVFCPIDQRMVAAIVIYRGERIAWTVGAGRVASHGALLAEFLELEHDYVTDMNSADLDRDPDRKAELSELFEGLQQSIAEIREHRYPMVDEGIARPLSHYAAAREPLLRARCPGCKTASNVLVDPSTDTLTLAH